MNTIFLKEVPDSVLRGKRVRLNYVDIGSGEYVIEINISNKIIKCIKNESLAEREFAITNIKKFSMINNLYKRYTLYKVKKDIIKIITKNDLIGYSIIYSIEIKKNKVLVEYLENLFNLLSINEYINTSSVQENLNKYIDEYINKNNISKENISPLIIVNDTQNLNLNLVNELNKKYKEVNIYSSIKPDKRLLTGIKKINDEYGSYISVLNKADKNFKKYNVYMFIDKSRSEYTRCKFNIKACFIDFTNKENDRFNQKYIKLENEIKRQKYDATRIKELYELYGKVTVATVIVD